MSSNALRVGRPRRTLPISSSYIHVISPQVVVTYPHKSTARSTTRPGCIPRTVPSHHDHRGEGAADALPVLPAHRLEGAGLPGGRGRRGHPAAAAVPGLRAAVHHAGADAA